MKKFEEDYGKVCALCKYFESLDIDNKCICKYKNSFKTVLPENSCRHFSFDLLKLEPMPKRPYSVLNSDFIKNVKEITENA